MSFIKEEQKIIPGRMLYTAWSATMIEATQKEDGRGWHIMVPNANVRKNLEEKHELSSYVSFEGFDVLSDRAAEEWVKFLGPLIDQITNHTRKTVKSASEIV